MLKHRIGTLSALVLAAALSSALATEAIAQNANANPKAHANANPGIDDTTTGSIGPGQGKGVGHDGEGMGHCTSPGLGHSGEVCPPESASMVGSAGNIGPAGAEAATTDESDCTGEDLSALVARMNQVDVDALAAATEGGLGIIQGCVEIGPTNGRAIAAIAANPALSAVVTNGGFGAADVVGAVIEADRPRVYVLRAD